MRWFVGFLIRAFAVCVFAVGSLLGIAVSGFFGTPLSAVGALMSVICCGVVAFMIWTVGGVVGSD